jgi:ATP-grasp domain
VTQEPVFGPLVTLEPGGAAANTLAGHLARLTPLTDADELIRSSDPGPLLRGDHSAPPAGLAALRDVLLRVSRLADDTRCVRQYPPGGAPKSGRDSGPLANLTLDPGRS